MRLRVAYVARDFWPRIPAGLVTTQIATQLVKRKQTVELVIPNMATSPEHLSARRNMHLPNELRIARVGPRISGPAANSVGCSFLLFRGILAAIRSDVILSQHHYSWSLSFFAAIISLVTRRPLVIRSDDCIPGTYGEPESPAHKFLSFAIRAGNLWAIRRAKLLLVQSRELAEWCRLNFGIEGDCVVVSHNGVDTARFSPKQRSNQLRRELNSEHIIIYSGTIIGMRALDDLLHAAAILKPTIPDIRIVILGAGPDLPRIKTLTISLGLEQTVMFTGPVDPHLVPAYLASADVAIGLLRSSPQTYGSNPVKVLEYMASGVVTVAVKNTAASDLLASKNSLITKPNADDLAAAILKILSNPAYSAELIKCARETVEKQYDWEQVISDLLLSLGRATNMH